MSPGLRVGAGASDSGTILHVPHSSRTIPPSVRPGIVLDDDALEHELTLMTDAHTELIAERAAATASRRPWLFVNRLSRLVVDPERFPDEREEMSRVGMGAVYTRTAAGAVLRPGDPLVERRLLDDWYIPYAAAMSELVDARLAATGRVTIVDVHSYPAQRLPYEIGGAQRPAVCLGTDPDHTPQWLVDAGRAAFAADGETAENTPFAGCYVPLKHYGVEPRVTAIMIEIRRDRYLPEPGGPPTAAVAAIGRSLAALVDAIDTR